MGRKRSELLHPLNAGEKAAGPTWLGNNKKAIGIVRVSTRRQGDNNSPELQKRGIRNYATKRGLQLKRIEEIHESAKTSAKRKKFHAAIEKAKQEGIRHIIFWVWDRTTRNFTDHEMMEDWVREEVFVLHLANDHRVLHKRSPDTDWMAADFNTATAKAYSRDLRRRAIESMQSKAESGWYPSKAPFGYINVKATGPGGQIKDRGGTLAATDWGKRAIRKMSELRMAGDTLNVIADKLIAGGLIPPKHQAGFKGSGKRAKVEYILKDPFYKGQFIWRGTLYDGLHDPVLTPAEWEALQSTFRQLQAPYRQKQRDAPLAGFMRCAECGCQITYDPKTKKTKVYHYYRCANGKQKHPKLTYVQEQALFDQFKAVTEDIYLHEQLAQKITLALNESHNQIKAARKREAQQFRKALESLEVREDDLYDDLKRGILDDSGYKRQLQRIRDQRRQYTQLLEQANDELDDAYLYTAQRALELATKAKILWESQSPQDRRRFLELVLSDRLLRGVTVEYELKKPFKILAEMREEGDWRARLDCFRTAVMEMAA